MALTLKDFELPDDGFD